MAGCGRNATLLKQYFHRVSLMDSGKIMVDQWPRNITGHHKKVQDFSFGEQRFDCIIGVWSLCYLNTNDRGQLIDRIFRSLRPQGFLILFEPVLRKDEPQVERLHKWREQQMVIRSQKAFQQLLINNDWSQCASGRYKDQGLNDEEMCSFIAQKGGQALKYAQ